MDTLSPLTPPLPNEINSFDQLQQPCRVGQLILDYLEQQPDGDPTTAIHTRASLAKAIGIDSKFMWEIIWGKRPRPFNRMDQLAQALKLSEEQKNALSIADNEDYVERRNSRRD